MFQDMSRRESLKWLGLLAAGSAVGLTAGCTKALEDRCSLLKRALAGFRY